MKSKDKNIDANNLDSDIEALSKHLYLESPDLWIDFKGKMNDNIYDEMVLFFASKYNAKYIIQHAIENNLINLDSPSRNKSYSNIREHLMYAAKQNNNNSIFEYLNDPQSSKELSVPTENKESKSSKSEVFAPKYICSNCNSNIFESGYIVTTNSTYKFSPKDKTSVEVSKNISDSIICSNCNSSIDNVTPETLKNLCHIQSCSRCGLDLKNIGIVDKLKMEYNCDEDKFVTTSTSYHCSNCDNIISNEQKQHFNL